MKTTVMRKLAKTLTWRAVGCCEAFGLTYFLTGKVGVAVGFVLAFEFFGKGAIYYLHELAWEYFGTRGATA